MAEKRAAWTSRRVIYDSRQGDIVNQYIVFSRVFDEQRRLYPDDRRKAVRETIRICRERDVLREYLAGEEAAAVMFTFADQVDAMQEALETERAEGEARGEARGESKMSALMDRLLSLGRIDDARRAARDEGFRAKLFSELKIL